MSRKNAGTAPGIVSMLICVAHAAWPATAAADPPLVPGNANGLFVVEDVREQFTALKHHPEALAWRNPEASGAIDPSIFDHYQGLVRNPRRGIAPVFYVSQLDDDDGLSSGGYLHVVQFGSRTLSGERLRSNLQRIGSDTEEANPAASDTWVRSLRFDSNPVFGGIVVDDYKHPGSMALVDDVLVLPIDQPIQPYSPIGYLLLFDVRPDPLDPVPLRAFPLDHSIDNVGVARDADGTYLIWTNGGGGTDINIYRTTKPDLRDPTMQLTRVQQWSPSTGYTGPEWPSGFGAHQASALLRESDGQLYLIGTRHPGGLPNVGEDFADLYQVDEPSPNVFVLTHLRTRQFNCVYDGGGGPMDMRVCNMTASSNAYVSPSGELMLYSMPHDDEDGFDVDIVRMAEFRHRDVNREGSPLRLPTTDAGGPYSVPEGAALELAGAAGPRADRPWVELYDDEDFGDRSVVVDFDDRQFLELSNFDDLDDFGDKTSSVRWRSPPGLDIVLYDDAGFSDRRVVLRGTGATEAIADLDPEVVVTGIVEQQEPDKPAGAYLEFGDKTSSLRWIGAEPDPGVASLAWDLDGDGVFGETGAAAGRGDETGEKPLFDAMNVDGPAVVGIALRAVFADPDATGSDAVSITVTNEPPAVQTLRLNGGLAGYGITGVTVALGAGFMDVRADTQTALIDWNDGTSGAGSVAEATDTVTSSHVYTAPNRYTVRVRVTDDDGGVGEASAPVDVLNPATALNEAIRLIDVQLAGPLSSADRAALTAARQLLAGNRDGLGANGAVDKLDAAAVAAFQIKIARAQEELRQVGGVNVDAIVAWLRMIAMAVS